MWTDSVVNIRDQQLTLSVRLLESEARDSVAATLAWLASTPADSGTALNDAMWKVFVEDVLGPNVRFTVDSHAPELVGMRWWDEAIRYAARTFVRANALDELARRFLQSLDARGQAGDRVC